MGLRKVRGGARKKTATSNKLKTKLKFFAMDCFLWLLGMANLIFVISMVFQILNATGGEKIAQAKENGQNIKSTRTIIKIEVLNGCGVNRLAARLREYLIDKNYDVIDFKNYDRVDIPGTLVIDRKYMDKRNAKKIARVIGVNPTQVFPQISPQRKLDVSIIIGKDYQQLKAFK